MSTDGAVDVDQHAVPGPGQGLHHKVTYSTTNTLPA